jgi:hypothetical protein
MIESKRERNAERHRAIADAFVAAVKRNAPPFPRARTPLLERENWEAILYRQLALEFHTSTRTVRRVVERYTTLRDTDIGA